MYLNEICRPLYPGSCYNAALRLLPLIQGTLQLEALRVIDVMSNETVEVHDLPDIKARERILGGEGDLPD